MSKITITLDVIKQPGGRVFVVPSQEDIAYDIKIHQGRLREATTKLLRLEDEQSTLTAQVGNPTDSTLRRLRELDDSIPAQKDLMSRIEAMLDTLAQVEVKRQSLITIAEPVTLDFTEPEWGDVASNEERFKKLVESSGTYVVDYGGAYNALLRKCCPAVASQPIAVAERMMVILRRYTEVNMTDLPFLL